MAGALTFLLSTTALAAPIVMDTPAYMTGYVLTSTAAINNIAWPVGHQAGDILLLAVQTANQAMTTPSGFTAVATAAGTGGAGAAGSTRLSLFWMRATSSAMGTFNIADSGDHQYVHVSLWRGCVATGSPFSVASTITTSAASSALSIAGITTPVAACLVIAVAGLGTNASGSVIPTPSTMPGWSWVQNWYTTDGVDGGLMVGRGVMATAGATGTVTATLSKSATHAKAMMCMSPVQRAAAPTINLVGQTVDTGHTSDANSAGFTVGTNGWLTTDTGAVQTWCSNPAATSEYEVRPTVTSGYLSYGTTGAWHDAGTYFSVECFGDSSAYAQLTLDVRKKGTSTILASAQFTLQCSSFVEPIGPQN